MAVSSAVKMLDIVGKLVENVSLAVILRRDKDASTANNAASCNTALSLNRLL